MTDASNLDLEAAYGEQTLRRNEQVLKFRLYLYCLMLVYIAAVSANAISIIIAFWLRVFGLINIEYEWLAAWAVGSGGLGAGSFAFKAPIKKLFDGPL